MILNCSLNLLRLNSNVPLCGDSRSMLQQSVHQRNIKVVNHVNICCVQLLIRLIMHQKQTEKILNRNLRPSNSLSLGPSICYARPHTHSYHGQFRIGGWLRLSARVIPETSRAAGSRPYGFTNYDMPLKTKTYHMHRFSKQK